MDGQGRAASDERSSHQVHWVSGVLSLGGGGIDLGEWDAVSLSQGGGGGLICNGCALSCASRCLTSWTTNDYTKHMITT